MFWILNSENLASNPSFWTMRAYLRDAKRESSSLFAPVTTIFPEAKMSAVVFGSRIRIMTAAKRYVYGKQVAHALATREISRRYQPLDYIQHCARAAQSF